ncbi:hypothetical protein GCM10025772_13300 [Ferrimonas gelatinilytica]|uniref:CHRD domain-containing protein n=1 Tax=Ferrimonas gelatinilytica TaxID=1255257 RepID=A0ABP9S369_9GAMM
MSHRETEKDGRLHDCSNITGQMGPAQDCECIEGEPEAFTLTLDGLEAGESRGVHWHRLA